MKEVTIVSGKGGTGKTSVTAALASLAKNAVFCDNDVDAADLHLILQPEVLEDYSFPGGTKAVIDQSKCIRCGICLNLCRYNAISVNEDGEVHISNYQCEGCRLCERFCPENAISSITNENNRWFVSNTRFGPLVHAYMMPGEENSGRLVSKIRSKAMEIAKEKHLDYIINDGPPGIGCAAISSISGTNLVLIIVEPSLSGLHDMQRLVELVDSFHIKIMVVINKSDINLEISSKIASYLNEKGIKLITKIPFDKMVIDSMVKGKTLSEFDKDAPINHHIELIWNTIQEHFNTIH